MAVTAESNSQFLAFRRFIYSLSKQLSKEEAQAIVYIHFFDQKHDLQSASTLEILCKLESSGIATASKPDKLLELMKDLKRSDLVSEVKDFLKKRKNKTSLPRKPQLVIEDTKEDNESEADLVLRNTLEAALVQATVLLQHMEMIQNSISGCKIRRDKIKDIVTEAAQTSEVLAERLRKAEVRINQDQEQEEEEEEHQKTRWSGNSSREIPIVDQRGYINTFHSGQLLVHVMVSPIQFFISPNLKYCFSTDTFWVFLILKLLSPGQSTSWNCFSV